jgi:hypothetical protein
MTPAEIAINSLAQGLTSLPEGEAWFASHIFSERYKILKNLHYCVGQTHPQPDEVEVAIKLSGIKPSMTPCVVLMKWRTNAARGAEAVAELPDAEHMKAFKVLLALFSVADERRRNTQCRGGCTHDWHHLVNQMSWPFTPCEAPATGGASAVLASSTIAHRSPGGAGQSQL